MFYKAVQAFPGIQSINETVSDINIGTPWSKFNTLGWD
jgi:hypothetical protein